MEAEKLRWLVVILLSAMPLVARAAPSDPVGHYYLEGVRETGSELLLRADGGYSWYLSYGALDQASEGRWTRSGDIVTLTPNKPKSDGIFTLQERSPWTELAEQVWVDRVDAKARDAANARCPFALNNRMSTPYTATSSLDAKPSGAAQKASDSLIAVDRARARAELAAEKAVTGDASAIAVAQTAFDDWWTAQDVAEHAHNLAELPSPGFAFPKLPAVCIAPDVRTVSDIPEAEWRRGAAVVVGDPAVEMRYSGITVRFTYSDGHQDEDVTNNGGWAVAPMRGKATVVRLVLSLRGADPRPATFDISPLMNAIQTVRLDTNAVTGPPFRTMLLKIDGTDLIPTDGIRGRYARH